MAVIRFTAPKPYQDIGFRIIDKPWDRKRTRIVYDRGILQYVSCIPTAHRVAPSHSSSSSSTTP